MGFLVGVVVGIAATLGALLVLRRLKPGWVPRLFLLTEGEEPPTEHLRNALQLADALQELLLEDSSSHAANCLLDERLRTLAALKDRVLLALSQLETPR